MPFMKVFDYEKTNAIENLHERCQLERSKLIH